jgi:guanine nucleotide-binding protein subunit beta-2-like 1 protein
MTEVESKITTKEVGHLQGHSNWVTAIETGHSQRENEDTQVLISSSRDKTILIWKFNPESTQLEEFGEPVKCLTGHSHFVSDLALTNDNNHLLSASWDKEMRLWDLRTGKTTARFAKEGHEKEILSCAISNDGRYILSSGADKAIKLWNVRGECRHTVKDYNHQDWVSKIRYIPTSSKSSVTGHFFASVGWDGFLKIWNNQTFNIKDSFPAHDGNINALTISPRGNFIVTGGKDLKVRVFEFSDVEKEYPTHDVTAPITCLAFNPRCHWIAIGTETKWEVWDFESKDAPVIADAEYNLEKATQTQTESKKVKPTKHHQVTSISWNTLGTRLFVGYSNGAIKVYEITEEKVN